MADQNAIVRILRKVRALLARPDNDFVYSHWAGAEDATDEIDRWIDRIETVERDIPRRDIDLLFAPTGILQEVSVSSGWGDEFLRLAEDYDKATGQK